MGREGGQISGRILRMAITAFCCQRLRCLSLSPTLFALVSYAQLSTATTCVSSEWILGLGGWQENQKPATQSCHRLRNKAQLSEGDASWGSVRRPASGRRSGPSQTQRPSRSAQPSALLPLLLRPLPPQPSTEARPGWAAAAPGNPHPRRAPRAQF